MGDAPKPPSFRTVAAVWLLAFFVYNANLRPITTYDSAPARLLPFALLTSGDLHFDRFEPVLPKDPDRSYGFQRSGSGHLVSVYPLVAPLLATPLFLPAVLYVEWAGLDDRTIIEVAAGMEKIAASTIAALSAALVFVLLRRFAAPAEARLLTVAYAFGTGTWVIGSQALWQHGTSELLLAALLLVLLRPGLGGAALAGFLSGLLVANRAPNATFAAAALLFVASTRDRKSLLVSSLLAVVAMAVPAFWNLETFGHPLGLYVYVSEPGMFHVADRRFASGVAGLLVSPGRGLFVFSPFLLFLAASPGGPRTADLGRLLVLFVPAAALQLLVYGAFYGWTGGSAYGARFLTDMSPVLVLALVPATARLRGVPRAVFVTLVGFAVAVQAIGAFCYPAGGTNQSFDAWKLRNVQYVRELRAGPARPLFLDVAVCRGLGYESPPWGGECPFESE